MRREILQHLAAAASSRAVPALVTRLGDGCQALVQGGQVVGDLALEPAILEQVAHSVRLERSGPLPQHEDLFVRVYAPAPRLLVVGAVHVALSLAPMATLAGFDVTVIDPRRAFASAERFPSVALTHEWPDEAMARLAPDARTAVVALTHDPKIDDPALIAALNSPAFYVGALGSTRTHAQRIERLAAAGLGDRVARIHAPVGLALGGRAPGEIAVAIVAQMVQERYRGGAP
jgi:xanthine dehydrogenase accessory factor